MSDLRFVRELGAEFERLERAGLGSSGRQRTPTWSGRLPGQLSIALAVAVPVAIALLAIGFASHSHRPAQPSASGDATAYGLTLSGDNCRTPARTAPISERPPGQHVFGGMVRGASGRVAGIAWELLVQANAETLGGTEHGRLRLGGRAYGLCSPRPVPVPFGLINAGPHGVVYGYVMGGGSFRVTVSAGSAPLASSVTDTNFFILALPRGACSYSALSVTAAATPVTAFPPNIDQSLDANAPHFTTTMRFGDCRPHRLVTAISERGESRGRSPNAPLAHVTGQLKLAPPPGSRSNAGGTVWELTHNGLSGISVLAFGLSPGRYGIWLLEPHNRATAVALLTLRHHELQGSFDLPANAPSVRQLVLAAQRPGQIDTPGRVVLRAAPD
jgi:hypothetical protein